MSRFFKEVKEKESEINEQYADSFAEVLSDDFQFSEKDLEEIEDIIDENDLKSPDEIIQFVKEQMSTPENSSDGEVSCIHHKRNIREVSRNAIFGLLILCGGINNANQDLNEYRNSTSDSEIVSTMNEGKSKLKEQLISDGKISVENDDDNGEIKFVFPESFDETIIYVNGFFTGLAEIESSEQDMIVSESNDEQPNDDGNDGENKNPLSSGGGICSRCHKPINSCSCKEFQEKPKTDSCQENVLLDATAIGNDEVNNDILEEDVSDDEQLTELGNEELDSFFEEESILDTPVEDNIEHPTPEYEQLALFDEETLDSLEVEIVVTDTIDTAATKSFDDEPEFDNVSGNFSSDIPEGIK